MLGGVRATKGGGVAVSVQLFGETVHVDGQPYVYGARALQVEPGLCMFPLIPALPNLPAWRAWVDENPGGTLPAPLDCMMGACVWVAIHNLQPASLPLEQWTSLVKRLSQRQIPANSAQLLGVLRNKEAAKTKKVVAVKPAKKRAPPKARKARKARQEEESEEEEEFEEDAESVSEEGSVALESEESFAGDDFESSSDSEEFTSESEGTSEEELSPRVGVQVRIVPNLD